MSTMETLPSLDAHAHIAANRTADELVDSGAVLPMTGSLDETTLVIDRRELYTAWGVGCHARIHWSEGIIIHDWIYSPRIRMSVSA
jgi:hypothetical protein